MASPFKEAQISRDKATRKRVYNEYEPVVLWVKPGIYMIDETGSGTVEPSEIIRRKLKENIDADFIDVAGSKEPYIEKIVTEFD